MLKRFAYHGVTVSNLDSSLGFYQDLLNMRLERTYEVAGEGLEEATGLVGAHMKVAVLRSSDGYLLKLMQYLSPEGKKRFEERYYDVGAAHMSIQVDDLQGTYEKLRAKGVKFISPPVYPIPQLPDVVFTYMLDPDGIIVELHRWDYHHAYTSSNMYRAVRFYRDLLGLRVNETAILKGKGIEEGSGVPGVFIWVTLMILDSPHEWLEIFHFMHPEGGKQRPEIKLCDVGYSYVAFDVDDVQQAYEELLAKGVKFVSPPVHLAEENPEVTMVHLLDPDGHVMELRCEGTPVR